MEIENSENKRTYYITTLDLAIKDKIPTVSILETIQTNY